MRSFTSFASIFAIVAAMLVCHAPTFHADHSSIDQSIAVSMVTPIAHADFSVDRVQSMSSRSFSILSKQSIAFVVPKTKKHKKHRVGYSGAFDPEHLDPGRIC